jgi:hypothetical protein
MRHNARLILMLAQLEDELTSASGEHYSNRKLAVEHLEKARGLIETNLAERQQVYSQLVSLWGQTRLPKGMSLPGKPYVFARDRARHFANRTADMSYLILDEQLLDLEGYLAKLKTYTADYRKTNRL